MKTMRMGMVLGLVAWIGMAAPATAATYLWTQTNSGTFNWSDAANWSNNAVPPAGGATNMAIEFFTNATPFGVGFFQIANNDLGDITLNSFLFNSRNNNVTNHLFGGAFRFVANGTNMPRLTIDANGQNTRPIMISNNIVLAGWPLSLYFNQGQNSAATLFKGDFSGTGNVVQVTGGLYNNLGGVKTFTGDLVVSNKLLYLDGTNAFTGNLVVKNGGNVYLRGPNAANDFNGVAIVEPGGFLQIWPGSQIGVWNNTVTNNGALSYYYSGANGVGVFNGLIYGSGTNIVQPASGGTLYLTNALNPFTGKTDIQSQNLVINTLGNVNGGPTSLGNPDSVSNGTINLGSTTTPGTLKYIGAAATSDRVINLSGTTGGGFLDASGTGPLVLTATNHAATGAGAKTLTLQGSNADSNTIQGIIPNNSAANKTALTKTGTGTWVLQGTNTYTGVTTVNGGLLVVLGNQASATGNTLVTSGTLRIGGSANLGPGNLSLNGGVLESAGDVALPGGMLSGQMQIPGGASGFSARGGDIQVAFGSLGAPDSLTWGTAPFIPSTFILNAATADGKLVFRNPINLNGTANARTNTLQVNAASAELGGLVSQSGAGYTLLNKTGSGLLILATNSTANAALTITAGSLQIIPSNSLPSGVLTLAAGTLLDLRNDTGTVYLDSSGPHAVAFSGTTGSYTINVDRAAGGSGVNQTHVLGNLTGLPIAGVLTVTGGNGFGLSIGNLGMGSGSSAAAVGSVYNRAPGMLTVTGKVTASQSSNQGWILFGGSGDIEVLGGVIGTVGGANTGLTKTDGNTLILSCSNLFGGSGNAVTVNGGTLRVNHPYGLPNYSGVVSNAVRVYSGTLDLNGYSFTVNGASFGSSGAASAAVLDPGTGTVTLIGNILFTNNAAGDNASTISGTLSLNNAVRSFTVHDAASTPYDMTVSADIAGGGAGGALTKAGLGALRLSGSNSFSGATLINAGALVLDYTDNTNNKIAPGAPLTIGSANNPASLVILGTPPTGLSVGGLTVSGISNSLVLPASTILNAGAVNISLGASPLTVTAPAGSSVQVAAGLAGGILTNSGGIVVGTYNGNDDWAARDTDGVTLTSLSAVNGYTAMGTYAAGLNADITGNVTPPANATFNSLRFNTAAACTLTLSGFNTLPTGGILVTPAVGTNRTVITGGFLRPNSFTGGREFAILQNNPDGDLLLGTILTNNSGNAYVAKSGPGRLIMTAHNLVGGSTYINAGVLQFGDGSTTGALTQLGTLYLQNGTTLKVAGGTNGLVVSTAGGIVCVGYPVIDVPENCELLNGTMYNSYDCQWVKTGLGTLHQVGTGFAGGWVKEGTFLSDAGINYTLNSGGVVIGATNAGAPSALVKLLGTKDPVIGTPGGVINRTGTLDINGKVQTVGNLTFNGGGLVTNSGSPAKLKLSVVGYNTAPGVGETAVVTMDVEGSSSRNDSQALQLTVNDDPDLAVELAIYGGVSNYPGVAAWGMQKLGNGTLYFAGTNTWSGIAQVLAGILIANRPASLPGYLTTGRWPVSAGATLAVCAGGADEWTAADIDALRAVSPSHFAASAWLGIDTTAGEFTYASVIGNGAGALGLRKLGTNQLVLANANTFTGGTVIHGGTLVASNAGALGSSGTITVNSNAALAVGSGVTFTRAVSFQPGSALAGQGSFVSGGAWTLSAGFSFRPGLPLGVLTVNAGGAAVTLGAGNALRVNCLGAACGKLVVTGTLNLSNPTAKLVLSGSPSGRRIVLAEATAVTGQFEPANVDMTALNPKGTISYTATEVILNPYVQGALIMIR